MAGVSPIVPQGGGSFQPDIQTIVRQALAYIRAHETDRALACLTAHPEVIARHSFACFLTGLLYVNSGDDAAALPFYDRALALNPRYAEALEGRARVMQRSGRFKDAIADYDALFRIKPASVKMLCNLGAAFEGCGHRKDALACYDRSLEAAPGYAPALMGKALLFNGGGQSARALAMLEALIAAEPTNALAWYNCGVVHAGRNEQAKAHRCFVKAHALLPAYGSALYGAATALQRLGRLPEALAACDKLLSEAPSDLDALFLRGNILYEQRRLPEALASFDRAFAQNPWHLGVLCNRGATLRELGCLAEAGSMFDAALAQNPKCVEGLLGRGIVEFKSARIEPALASFERAIEADPSAARAYCGRGLALQHLGRIDDAKRDFERTLVLKPGLPEGHSNLGALQLLLGDFERGWEGYEYRRIAGDRCKAEAGRRWPVWNGEEIAGKKLLVLEEAAHGDAIMLARYFPMLAALGADATVECLPRMAGLLEQVPGVRLVTEIDPAERFDYQVHLFSLPRAFKTRVDTVPAPVPYLAADPALAEKWGERLKGDGFKIGIAWQGNPDPKIDIARAAPLESFAALTAVLEVRLISLQKGFGAEQIASSGLRVETLGDDFDAGPSAFLDTAAVMANLDLVVSVDTSIAHLAGALGRPVWVALKHIPEWRWMLGREDSPWYPTMRLFRQRAMGHWSGVFERMAEALQPLIAGKNRKRAADSLLVPAAVGELIDKLTILEIKAERIPDPRKLANVKRELALLSGLKKSRGISGRRLDALASELKRTNTALWEIEDAIRQCERAGDFGPDFVALARRVYQENDKRALLKRDINVLFGSDIVEEKYYAADEAPRTDAS
jgi:tetratricopeptide (TPR) repeat protein